ncbi:MAG: DNA gyrase subunit A, partial [Proteobacteria bacterium]|nr:DNA gyrase subunit A [Pseudomonadota bacterium]
DQDVLLSTRQGKSIRFESTDVRVFTGRTSTGVRGIRLMDGDEVMSVSVLDHAKFSIEERDEYLRLSRAVRAGEEVSYDALPRERFDEMQALEQFVLCVTENGFGKRTSAYEYRITGRGGQGVTGMALTPKTGPVVASFIVQGTDQLVLVTDGGQLIRCPLNDVRIAGRVTQGVTLFRVAEGERIVSVARIPLEEGEDEGDADETHENESQDSAPGEA